MIKSIFGEGEKQGITEVLAQKDRRVQLQNKIFEQYPQGILLDVKLNVPGPIKNNRYLKQIFKHGCNQLEQELLKNGLKYSVMVTWDEPAGMENFYLLFENSQLVKKVAIRFEDKTELNRLFDADVLVKNKKQALSRSELNQISRRCFLCNRPAKDCARSRRHSIDELQNYLTHLYNKYFN
ncbi:citrate lyase holo-[acyl-carrier protein] synthase [Lactobacillus sp. ESL0228]|uniref:citrate lyase holo-[acyl-carrier protein] synthase n=1 Tax=Lactobacillus sp. ESL0228 TaxID=2069352 RepID=UPI000EFD6BEC|nr:citrate lyase holo-[acyl-carrier protein] synthase [Lactobacillus sp. ESL0228]RMC48862.1 citrate lyase holo-[acyl-carrier protein] synthase [Lactobacillus sp. ESL0228]